MKKTEAINILGGTVKKACKAIGMTHQAIYAWPDVLSPLQEGRILVWMRDQERRKIAAAHRKALRLARQDGKKATQPQM